MRAKNLTEWRNIILKRANYTCQICGSTENLQTHHIHQIITHPELELELDNGLALCRSKCHRKIPIIRVSNSYKWYNMKLTGADMNTVRTTIPRYLIRKICAYLGVTILELLKGYNIVWHYGNFEGAIVNFTPKLTKPESI